jgi:hypothetical protein
MLGGLSDFSWECEWNAFDDAYIAFHNEIEGLAGALAKLVPSLKDLLKHAEMTPETEREKQKRMGHSKPIHKYLATAVFDFWTRVLRREPKVTHELTAFAEQVHSLLGYPTTEGKQTSQLHKARRRQQQVPVSA